MERGIGFFKKDIKNKFNLCNFFFVIGIDEYYYWFKFNNVVKDI